MKTPRKSGVKPQRDTICGGSAKAIKEAVDASLKGMGAFGREFFRRRRK
jgi:hypothetical protein